MDTPDPAIREILYRYLDEHKYDELQFSTDQEALVLNPAEDLPLSDTTTPVFNLPVHPPYSESASSTINNEWSVMDKSSNQQRPPRLIEFLKLLLKKPDYHSYAEYTDVQNGIFRIKKPEETAHLWEQVKHRQSTKPMTYDKFSRCIRCYYKSKLMKKTNTSFTFQFVLPEQEVCKNDEKDMMDISSIICCPFSEHQS
jgi:hypothetical protein